MIPTLLAAAMLAGGYQDPVPELHKVPGPAFLIPCKVAAADAVAEVQLWVSADRGKTWQLYEAITPNTDAFTFVAKKSGEYWFAPRIKKKDGTHLPADVSELAATQRVAVATGNTDDGSPPSIPLRPLPRTATARDTAAELDDELDRVELELIRKEIKRLGESNSLTPGVEDKLDRLRIRLRDVRERTRPDRDPLVTGPSPAWQSSPPLTTRARSAAVGVPDAGRRVGPAARRAAGRPRAAPAAADFRGRAQQSISDNSSSGNAARSSDAAPSGAAVVM